jgi:hypothetical protein
MKVAKCKGKDSAKEFSKGLKDFLTSIQECREEGLGI